MHESGYSFKFKEEWQVESYNSSKMAGSADVCQMLSDVLVVLLLFNYPIQFVESVICKPKTQTINKCLVRYVDQCDQ